MPASGVELAHVDEKPQPIMSLQEVHHLLDCARELNHEWYPVWTMALNTGMRSGELYALEWSDIDLEGKLITVSKSYNKRMNENKSTKAGYWRKVPINSELESLLVILKNKAPNESAHVLPRIGMWRRGEDPEGVLRWDRNKRNSFPRFASMLCNPHVKCGCLVSCG